MMDATTADILVLLCCGIIFGCFMGAVLWNAFRKDAQETMDKSGLNKL